MRAFDGKLMLGYFPYFCITNIVAIIRVVQMRDHNISFYVEWTEIT